jgi:hypothetical protein
MSFPAVEVLDPFHGREPENPLGLTEPWAGRWKELFESSSHKGKITGEWETISGPPTIEGGYWHPSTFKEPGVAGELTFNATPGAGSYWALWACVEKPGEIHFTGYRLKIIDNVSREGHFTFKLEKAVLGVWTVMVEKAEVIMEKNDRFGIAVQSGVVSGWRKKGAGSWEEILNHSDSSYTEGYIGFTGSAGFGILINFEGPAEAVGPPVVENPGTRHSTLGESVSLQIHSTFTTEYKAEGLPEGLSINEGTGLITGTSTKLESTKVKIKVKGPEGTDETEFEWIIEEAGTAKANRTFMVL